MKSDPPRQKAEEMIDTSLNEKTAEEVLAGVHIPLENVEYTIERYLLENGSRLDTDTRFLLAGVRDCVGRVAGSTRRMVGMSPDDDPSRRRS